MKKTFLFFVTILFLLGCNIVLAEDSYRIGLIDLQRCLKESREGRKAFTVLKKKKDNLQKQLDGREKEILELQQALEKQKMMLSMDAKEDKKKTIDRKTRELKYLLKDLNEEMVRAQEKEKKRIFKKLEKVIKQIGSEGNYTLLLEKRAGGVLYFSESIDITDEIIKAYDKQQEAK